VRSGTNRLSLVPKKSMKLWAYHGIALQVCPKERISRGLENRAKARRTMATRFQENPIRRCSIEDGRGVPRRRKRNRVAVTFSAGVLAPIVRSAGLLAVAPSLASGRHSDLAGEPVGGPSRVRSRWGSLSLGWFSPITAGDITLRDRKRSCGQAAAAQRRQVACRPDPHRSNLGHFEIDSRRSSRYCAKQGSNLEDVLARYWSRDPAVRR